MSKTNKTLQLTDYLVNEIPQDTKAEIRAYFPGCISYIYISKEAPTFGRVYDHLSSISNSFTEAELKKKYGDDYTPAFSEVYVTVKTETEGHEYKCDFNNRVFTLEEDSRVPSLLEERQEREKRDKEYEEALKLHRKKQCGRIISALTVAALGAVAYFAGNPTIALFSGITFSILSLKTIAAHVRFEDSGGFFT